MSFGNQSAVGSARSRGLQFSLVETDGKASERAHLDATRQTDRAPVLEPHWSALIDSATD